VTRDLGVASALLALPVALRAPLVFESHGYAPEVAAALPNLVATAAPPSARKLRRLARREAAVWQRAEGYVTITAALADELRRHHGTRPRVAVVPDGVRLRPQSSEFRKPGSPAVVGYAGHLYVWKGVDVLLEALARMPGVRGVIVGGHAAEPDLARLQTLAQRLGVAERVTFTGMVEPSHVPEHLRQADVLVLPNPASAISTRFTSPLKLFEYMASGRPIVSTDLPAIREILTDEVNALLVTPGDASAISAAIGRVLADPALAQKLAHAALAAVPDYSWDRRAERLEALFGEVIAVAR
jgi:glycosyltransferase involved in cell wall biosynthesis